MGRVIRNEISHNEVVVVGEYKLRVLDLGEGPRPWWWLVAKNL